MKDCFRELIRENKIAVEKTNSNLSLEEATLRYYLLSRPAESLFSCECSEGLVYGVAVTINGGVETLDPGFSYLRSEAVDFINEIADALVTPVSFLSLVDEYVGIF